MGDFNVARTDADVFDIKAFVGSTHVTPEERAGLESLIDWGLVDVPARPGKNDRPFTYWDYRAGMFHQGPRHAHRLRAGQPVADRSSTRTSTARPARASCHPTMPR